MKKYYIPPNAPPPLTMEQCTNRSTQKDAADIKPTTKPLTFDDIEGTRKTPKRIRQGDSITTSVAKTVNTSVAYISLYNQAPQRAIAPLPNNSLEIIHPGAVLIECPEELKMGMRRNKPISISESYDPNQILECKTYR